ncbi:hypothetical protein O9992_27715 [Vibrio lentus]|nr:hypothetical protein [Vibrio lentus]
MMTISKECFDAAAPDDYVPKPFKFEILKEKVLAAVERTHLPATRNTLVSTTCSGHPY